LNSEIQTNCPTLPSEIGQSASLVKRITAQDVRQFAELSLDANPIHLDEEYAKTTRFGRPIAQGIYVASFLSAVLANELPGPGTIYLGQELNFKRPVFIGDIITATVTILDFPKPTLIKLSTVCTNQEGKIVIDGFALVKKE
jgi:acyl dehydratase